MKININNKYKTIINRYYYYNNNNRKIMIKKFSY